MQLGDLRGDNTGTITVEIGDKYGAGVQEGEPGESILFRIL